MADAQISNLTAGVTTGGPTSITGLVEASGTDITVVAGGTTYLLSSYISGTNTALTGSYTFNAATGMVTSATYTGVNFASGKFQ